MHQERFKAYQPSTKATVVQNADSHVKINDLHTVFA